MIGWVVRWVVGRRVGVRIRRRGVIGGGVWRVGGCSVEGRRERLRRERGLGVSGSCVGGVWGM